MPSTVMLRAIPRAIRAGVEEPECPAFALVHRRDAVTTIATSPGRGDSTDDPMVCSCYS